MIHPVLNVDISKASSVIKEHDEIFLFTHHDPDGDALASIAAMDLALKRMGKKVSSFISGNYSEKYNFLPLPLFERESSKKDADLLIILDCSNLERTGFHEDNTGLKAQIIINVDHHPQENKFGSINIVDTDSTSASELVLFLLFDLGIEIDRDLAQTILTGIVADTGSFKHAITGERAFKIASFLAQKGANIKTISENVERSKKIPTIKLWGRVLSRIKTDRAKGIVTSVITHQDLADCGASKEDLEGVVNLISAIPESKAALLLREEEQGLVKGSLRSESGGLDVRKVASIFGGGGHIRASGFKIKGKIKETPAGWEISE